MRSLVTRSLVTFLDFGLELWKRTLTGFVPDWNVGNEATKARSSRISRDAKCGVRSGHVVIHETEACRDGRPVENTVRAKHALCVTI